MPYPDAGRSLVHERDIAEVAIQALLDPSPQERAVLVTGPAVLTQREQVSAIGVTLGRELTVEEADPEQARREYAATMGSDFAEQALSYWAGLVDEPEAVTTDVPEITGHPALPFAEWAHENRHQFERRDKSNPTYAD